MRKFFTFFLVFAGLLIYSTGNAQTTIWIEDFEDEVLGAVTGNGGGESSVGWTSERQYVGWWPFGFWAGTFVVDDPSGPGQALVCFDNNKAARDEMKTYAIDIAGYCKVTISFKYWRRVAPYESADFFRVQYSYDGTNWTNIVNFNGKSQVESMPISPAEEDLTISSGTDLYLRVHSNCDGLLEGYYVDDIEVTGYEEEAPVISCTDDLELPTDKGVCSVFVDFEESEYLPEVEATCDYTLQMRVREWIGEAWGPWSAWSDDLTGTFNTGLHQVRWRAVNDHLQAASNVCTITLTVVDKESPEIECPQGPINRFTNPGVCTFTPTGNIGFTTPPTDNCGIVYQAYRIIYDGGISVTSTEETENGGWVKATTVAGVPFEKGKNTIEWLVEDAAGNTATCSYVVNVIDNEAPELTCPQDMIVSNDPGECGAEVWWYNIVSPDDIEDEGSGLNDLATDNCPGTIVTADWEPGDWFPVGETTVTLTATDEAGNRTTCSFTVTVNDDEAPTIDECPAGITRNTESGKCSAYIAKADIGQPVVADNCCNNSNGEGNQGYGVYVPCPIVTNDAPEDNIYPKGETTVTWTVTDAAGNSSTCKQIITVEDKEVPNIGACGKTYIVELKRVTLRRTAVYRGYLPEAPIRNLITDNCDVVGEGLEVEFSQTVFTPGDWGTNTETVTATDAAGNSVTCEITVIVRYPLKSGEVDIYAGIAEMDEISEVNLDVTVYPNPTKGKLTLDIFNLNNPEVMTVVYNMNGQVVFQERFSTAGQINIDLTGKISGMYLLKVLADEKVFMHKIILEER